RATAEAGDTHGRLVDRRDERPGAVEQTPPLGGPVAPVPARRRVEAKAGPVASAWAPPPAPAAPVPAAHRTDSATPVAPAATTTTTTTTATTVASKPAPKSSSTSAPSGARGRNDALLEAAAAPLVQGQATRPH